MADAPCVDWVSRLFGGLDASRSARREAREALIRAQQSRSPIEIRRAIGGAHGPMTAMIANVDQDEFAITQPMRGAATERLFPGTRLEVRILGAGQPCRCATRTLGRTRIDSGGGAPLCGYRLAMPRSIELEERRSVSRVSAPEPMIVHVEVRRPDLDAAIQGILIDMSPRGVQVRSPSVRDRIQPGDRVYVKFELPQPVGAVLAVARVVRSAPAERGLTTLGLAFLQPIPGMKELLADLHHNGPRALRLAQGAPA